MTGQNNSFDFQKLLPVAFVAAAGILLYLGLSDSGQSSRAGNLARDERVQASANEHLRRTAEKMEMERRQQALRSWQLVNEYGKTVGERAYAPPREGAELQEGNSAESVARDLGRVRDQLDLENASASELIHHQLFEAQNAEMQDKAFRDEYARQFIENARRGGWEIKLDANYKVISVKKIDRRSRASSEFELF